MAESLAFRSTHAWCMATVALLALLFPRPAFAQAEQMQARELPEQEAEREETAHSSASKIAGEEELVFDSFRALRQMERARIRGASIATISFGAGMVATGVLLPEESRPWNLALGIGGGAMALAGVLSFVVPSPIDRMAQQFSVDSPAAHTGEEAEQLERAWRAYAQRMKTARYLAGGLGVAFGAAEVGLGVAWSAGAFSGVDRVDQEALGALLVGAGSAAILSGVATFFLRSPAEVAFAAYEESRARRNSLSVSMSAVPSGFTFGASGSF